MVLINRKKKMNSSTVSRIVRAACILIATISGLGCSVKEDRQPCPSWLQLYISGCATYSSSLSISLWNDQKIFGERVAISDYPDCYEREVTKGHYMVSSYTGTHRSMIEDTKLIIPYGEDADSLYAYSDMLACTEEFTRDTVSLLKKHACVTLQVNMPENEVCTYTYRIHSKICGTDLLDFSPIPGEFMIERQAKDNKVHFCLPRQDAGHPDDLYIQVEKEDGTPFHRIDLGKMIQGTGYNWDSRNLQDIILGIDYIQSEITLVIPDWDAGNMFEIEF